jgi:hypothetical protein
VTAEFEGLLLGDAQEATAGITGRGAAFFGDQKSPSEYNALGEELAGE